MLQLSVQVQPPRVEVKPPGVGGLILTYPRPISGWSVSKLSHPSPCYHRSPNPVRGSIGLLTRLCFHRGPHSHFATRTTLTQQISTGSRLFPQKLPLPLGRSPGSLRRPSAAFSSPPGAASSRLPQREPSLLLRLPASSSSGPPHRSLPPECLSAPGASASLLPEAFSDPTGHRTCLSCPRAAPVLVMACFLPLLCPGKLPTQYRSARSAGIYAHPRFAN